MGAPPAAGRRRSLATATALVIALALGGLAGCSRSHGSEAEFCDQVRDVPALEAVLARFSETDPDLLADHLDKARDAYHDLAAAAPSAIHDETAELVSVVDDILDAVADHPTDQAAAAAQLRKAMAEHPDAETARAKVAAYAEDRCDVRLDPTLTPSGTTTTTPAATTSTSDATTTAAG